MKTDFCFQKWHEEFGKFSPKHLKVSKLGLWWDSFSQSKKCMSLKFTGEILSWQWKKMQNWKKKWLVVSKLTWGIWQILTGALENLKNLHFNGLFLIKVYNVWTKEVQRRYIWWHWRLMQNLKENWFVLSKMTWRICQIFVHRLKNSNFILESKMAELNQNKNSKQPDRPNAVWKLCFIYLGNKWIAQLTKLFTCVLQNRCS